MSVLINEKIDNLLKTTSRSFYPTLKYLPKKVRGQIGLLYLLARVADTIADSKSGETDELLPENVLNHPNVSKLTKELMQELWFAKESSELRLAENLHAYL